MNNIILNLVALIALALFACNTTQQKEAGQRQGADLMNKSCYELSQSQCESVNYCRYDYLSYSCVNAGTSPGANQFQNNCSYYTSEYDCPRTYCRWSGYSCLDLNNNNTNTFNTRCQYYHNDPTGCQQNGCLYSNNQCQQNTQQQYNNNPYGGSPVVCSTNYRQTTCDSTPGCQWLNNQCRPRY